MCRWKDKGEPLPMAVIEAIPVKDRLPGLVNSYGLDKVSAILSKAITRSLANLNLRVGMNSDQVVDLSLSLIESAEEDQLAFEDIMLFLDGMIKGKYGKIYDRMDMPTFFELLEVYRDQRHKVYMGKKYEQESQFKTYGDTNRLSEDRDKIKDQFREAMIGYIKQSNDKPDSK